MFLNLNLVRKRNDFRGFGARMEFWQFSPGNLRNQSQGRPNKVKKGLLKTVSRSSISWTLDTWEFLVVIQGWRLELALDIQLSFQAGWWDLWLWSCGTPRWNYGANQPCKFNKGRNRNPFFWNSQVIHLSVKYPYLSTSVHAERICIFTPLELTRQAGPTHRRCNRSSKPRSGREDGLHQRALRWGFCLHLSLKWLAG